ncbi:ribosomal protein [Hirsutella rhossiliensis]|uniref:Ribosomal protein l17 domain-containing protein n=1 Tax=Hirsutella rhossiliensis TaxID=111463 RepID=A0A9P8SJ45_9HYPO|nr:ribosomal protein l17 domain-containing protein [Hirsutella rhossiliensis]KAH0963844.1 ribosomal protein l17 domain-containing protein [Hirsutella rhossiliensis]
MAGGTVKYRHLSRNSSARMALLRGLVTQLVQYEHIQTTYAKAKEAQRMAEKLITLAKKNNEPSRRAAQGILYTPNVHLPKLLGELRTRYLPREGGYTRVVRTESKNTYDQGESAILEFVDGPKDSRFMMAAKTLARDRLLGRVSTPLTLKNVQKVTRLRGEDELEKMVRRFMALDTADPDTTPEVESPEAAKMAARESAAVQKMAGDIVPDSVKKAAGESGRSGWWPMGTKR